MAGEQLRVSEGNARDTRLAVDGELLIGRAATEDDGRLGDDPELSRRHARLARGASGELTIEDLGSSNGTFVNGERIDARADAAALGDIVRVGNTVLQVTDASGRVPEPTQLGARRPPPTSPPSPRSCWWRRERQGPADRPGRRVRDRARRERRGPARRRSRALAPPRARVPRRPRPAERRGPRVGQRDVRQRRRA